MNRKTRELFVRFRAVGQTADSALRSAKTLLAFRKAEDRGLVRLSMKEEQESYFDVYGELDATEEQRKRTVELIENLGCYCVYSEFRMCAKCNTFEWADSIGFCIYEKPLDPFCNDYVIDLMASALAKL